MSQPYDVQPLLLRGLALVGGRVVNTVAAGMVACEMVICGHALSAAHGEGGDSGGGGGGAAGGGSDAAAAAAAAGGGSRGSGSDSAIGSTDIASKTRAVRGRFCSQGEREGQCGGGGIGQREREVRRWR